MIIRKALASEIDWINTRYDEIEFVHSDFDNELIAIAEINQQKAGMGRLVNVTPQINELGGMYVADAHRKRGIARKIVQFLLEYRLSSQVTYCIAFNHLVDFYKSCGFEDVKNPEKAPEKVVSKIDWCQSKYPHGNTLLVINEKNLLLNNF